MMLFVILITTIIKVVLSNDIFNNFSSTDRYQNKLQQKHIDRDFKSYPLNREPRFISFQTKDDNIEVEIDFAIPFLSIPVILKNNIVFKYLQVVIYR